MHSFETLGFSNFSQYCQILHPDYKQIFLRHCLQRLHIDLMLKENNILRYLYWLLKQVYLPRIQQNQLLLVLHRPCGLQFILSMYRVYSRHLLHVYLAVCTILLRMDLWTHLIEAAQILGLDFPTELSYLITRIPYE